MHNAKMATLRYVFMTIKDPNCSTYRRRAPGSSFEIGVVQCVTGISSPYRRGSADSPDRPVNSEFTKDGMRSTPYVKAMSKSTSGKKNTSIVAPSYGGGCESIKCTRRLPNT